MARLLLEYLILAFVSCLGLFQLIAVREGLHGISFFNRAIWGYLFAALTIGGSLSWFFAVENRLVPGLVGPQVFALLIAAFFLALVITLSLSSLIKRRSLSRQDNPEPGIDALRRMTYFQAIAHQLRRGKKDGLRR